MYAPCHAMRCALTVRDAALYVCMGRAKRPPFNHPPILLHREVKKREQELRDERKAEHEVSCCCLCV